MVLHICDSLKPGSCAEATLSHIVKIIIYEQLKTSYLNETARYVVWVTAYYVDMLKNLELRGYVADELGETFEIREIHTLVL